MNLQQTKQEYEAFNKGKVYFALLLATVVVVPVIINLFLLLIPGQSSLALRMSWVYPVESLGLVFISGIFGLLVYQGKRMRYLWLVSNMVQIIFLTFFSFQLFRVSIALGYLAIAACVIVLALGFYSFYQAEIQYYLRCQQERNSSGRQGGTPPTD